MRERSQGGRILAGCGCLAICAVVVPCFVWVAVPLPLTRVDFINASGEARCALRATRVDSFTGETRDEVEWPRLEAGERRSARFAMGETDTLVVESRACTGSTVSSVPLRTYWIPGTFWVVLDAAGGAELELQVERRE